MQYISVNGGNTWIEYNPDTHTSRVIVKSEIESQLELLNNQVSQYQEITDEMLLEWAKINYPDSLEYKNRLQTIKDKEELELILDQLK